MAAPSVASPASSNPSSPSARIRSIDALRGLVMFTMIFVNDIAGAPHEVVPAWMRHYQGKNGMTFVDLVFPAFLFIVGLSIPHALGRRLERGESVLKILVHVLTRVLSLLSIGILMVHGTPDSAKMGWPGALWTTLMYTAAMLAFCDWTSPRKNDAPNPGRSTARIVVTAVRITASAGLLALALSFRGPEGERILSLSPFFLRASWYGILGLIGWAYLVGALVFLVFRYQRTALLGCFVLLLALFPADRAGLFEGCWLARWVGIGSMLGSHGSITVAGVLLGAMLAVPECGTVRARTVFTTLFVLGCAAAAVLLHGLYGIHKNTATPSWCLWACAITAAGWLLFYYLDEVWAAGWITRPWVLAGENVLLAYLLSDWFPSAIDLLRLDAFYGALAAGSWAGAIGRSAGLGVALLAAMIGLNRIGFRVRL